MKKAYALLLFLLLAFRLSAAAETLRVFAAAGTAPAMKEIAAEYTRRTGTGVSFNFANAGILARQICAGADFDLFFSANEKWMDYAAGKNLINPATRIDLLENELVVIVPKGRSTNIELKTFSGRFAIGDQSTPLGIYAREAFTRMGCWETLKPHFCVGDTVNKALNYVVLGEADAGVVFRSLAQCAADRVEIAFTIPAELHAPIRFPAAAAENCPAECLDFLAFLQSPYAASTFTKYGWTPCITKK